MKERKKRSFGDSVEKEEERRRGRNAMKNDEKPRK